MDARTLRNQLQHSNNGFLPHRRALIGASLIGMASMTAVSLLQAGLVKHLPDPPLRSFDSDKVNSSEMAYQLGIPDGTLSLGSLAFNILLAAAGAEDRYEKAPWLPIAAGAKAILEGLVTVAYFLDMPIK